MAIAIREFLAPIAVSYTHLDVYKRQGRDEQLSELAEAAVEVVNAAYDLSDDIGELEGDLFTEAMELVDGDDESDFDDDEDFDDEDFYDGFEDEDFDDDGEYVEMTDAEVEAMQAVGKALAECGLLTPGEQLYICLLYTSRCV